MGYPHRDRELEGTLKLHEFMREAEDLQSWLASQKQVAGGGESLGEDYEDVLVRRGWGQGLAGLCVEGVYESWLRTGLLRSRGRRCGHPAPHRPDVSGGLAPQAACCLASWGHLPPLPLSPQHLCTEFVRFQHTVEMGGQRVASCQQLAEKLLERGHRAAPRAHQMQRDLQ